MVGRRDQAARPDLRVRTDVDGAVAEEPTEAVEDRPIANRDPALRAGSEIDIILEHAVFADTHIGCIDDFGPHADDGPLAHTPCEVAVPGGCKPDAEHAPELRGVGRDDPEERGGLMPCIHHASSTLPSAAPT